MTGPLSQQDTDRYRRDGVLWPLRAFDAAAAAALRAELEALERDHPDGAGGHELGQLLRINGQIVLPLLCRIAASPEILDPVESILGPDLLVWSVDVFIKEPGSEKRVSWHQDITYWGMGETDEELTAWLALSDVSVEAGCMRFIPGSHKNPILPHTDTFSEDNLLSRGQELPGVDEAEAVFGALKPGEMSFHHGRTFHASGPNRSADRRIGIAIRYVTPGARAPGMPPDYATLVRGCDRVGDWRLVAVPQADFEPWAMRLYDEVLAVQAATLTAGAEERVPLYAAKAGAEG